MSTQKTSECRTTNLFEPITLPCGVVLKNRIVKSAMSDSLGDGAGNPTQAQIKLYQKWAEGGASATIIGEVQCTPDFAEKPGNLVLNQAASQKGFKELAQRGQTPSTRLWLQLSNAGAFAFGPTSIPKGPSAFNLPELKCEALTLKEIQALPQTFAKTAHLAMNLGFSGVQIHAAHGFLLSQFLSPLFNKRTDEYGGSLQNRMRLLLEVIKTVRASVGNTFPIALKINSSDQLEGGLTEQDALGAISVLDASSIDVIEISGGTYFPGAKPASDRAGKGPYFIEFTKRARALTNKPLMLTGGFKTREQAQGVLASGIADLIGMARALIIEPHLPNLWKAAFATNPSFPRFNENIEGGITAWYTMKIRQVSGGEPCPDNLAQSLEAYEKRDTERTKIWRKRFAKYPQPR